MAAIKKRGDKRYTRTITIGRQSDGKPIRKFVYGKTIKEVDWATLKKNITNTEDGMVVYKETGDIIESLSTRETLPSIEVKIE